MEEKEKSEKYQKLLNLHGRLDEVKKMKKNAAADYRDQIKDIEGEIKDLVMELKEEDQ